MSKPYALVSFDPIAWDSKSLMYEVNVMSGVDDWILLFGNTFLLKKSASADQISESLRKWNAAGNFFIVEFDAEDANGILPSNVAAEVKMILRKSPEKVR